MNWCNYKAFISLTCLLSVRVQSTEPKCRSSLAFDLDTIAKLMAKAQVESSKIFAQEVDELKAVMAEAKLQFRKEISATNANLKKTQLELQESKTKIEKLMAELAPRKEIQTMKTELSAAKSDLVALKSRQAGMVSDIHMNKKGHNSTVSEIRTLQKQQRILRSNMSSLQTTVDNLGSTDLNRTNLNLNSTLHIVNGKINQTLLPGSYATATLEDVRWHSLHMAASAACLGAKTTKGAYSMVYPAKGNESCTDTCKTAYQKCFARVGLWGQSSKATDYRSWVAYFYMGYGNADDGCKIVNTNAGEEVGDTNDGINNRAGPKAWRKFCCCTR